MSHTVVGKLNKAFGIKGHVKVVPLNQFESDLKKGTVWFIKRGTETLPYFVESIEETPHFLVKFEDVDSPEDARKITGCSILLRDKDISIQVEESNDLDKLIDFTVEKDNEKLGKIVRIEEYPQQLMAFVENDHSTFMMPLTPEFIVDISLEAKKLSVDLPLGFIESQL